VTTAPDVLAYDPLLAQFARRAVVRASLYDARELSLAATIAPLKAEAFNTGLVHKYGRDTIDHIIGDAFSVVPHDLKIAALNGLEAVNGHEHMPAPLAVALIRIKDDDYVAFHRLRRALSPHQRALLDLQLVELKRTRSGRGHRRCR
jgi:hypothetical protein